MRKALFVMYVFLFAGTAHSIKLSELSMQQNNTWGGTQTFTNVIITGTENLTGTFTGTTGIFSTKFFVGGTLAGDGTNIYTFDANNFISSKTVNINGGLNVTGITGCLFNNNNLGNVTNYYGANSNGTLTPNFAARSNGINFKPYTDGTSRGIYFDYTTAVASFTPSGLTMNLGASINTSSMTVFDIFYCPQSATLPTTDVKAGGLYYETDTCILWVATENVVGVQSWVRAAKPGD